MTVDHEPVLPDTGRSPEPQHPSVWSAFERALARAGPVRRDFAIAGRRLRAACAGPAMLQVIEPALAHRGVPSEATEADLDVAVWDSASTGVALPPSSAADEESLRVYQPGVEILTIVEAHRGRAMVWVPEAESVAINEIAAPLRAMFHLWLRAHGVYLVHGAAVGTDGGGLLVVGRSGAGKSSTALACLGTELAIAGDDYVLVEDGARPRVHSLFSSAKLNADQLERFPGLRPLVANADRLATEKAVIFLARHAPEALIESFPLRGIVIPHVVGDGPPGIVPAHRAEALAALAPSTIFQLPFTGRADLARLARLLERLPAWRLRLGDPAGVPQLLEGIA